MAEYLEDWDCQCLDVVQVRHHHLLGSLGGQHLDLSSDRGNIRGTTALHESHHGYQTST